MKNERNIKMKNERNIKMKNEYQEILPSGARIKMLQDEDANFLIYINHDEELVVIKFDKTRDNMGNPPTEGYLYWQDVVLKLDLKALKGNKI